MQRIGFQHNDFTNVDIGGGDGGIGLTRTKIDEPWMSSYYNQMQHAVSVCTNNVFIILALHFGACGSRLANSTNAT